MRSDHGHMPIVLQIGPLAAPAEREAAAPPEELVARAGELILVEIESTDQGTFLADCFSGLSPAPGAAVRFLGHVWRDLSPDEASALRGLIGRQFARGEWIGYLSVEANVLIQQLHHTRATATALRGEAARLARDFDLPGVPQNLPADLDTADLRRAALVRAFLGEPRLILLEDPVHDQGDLLVPLLNAIARAREHGAAVLWFTRDPLARRQVAPHSTAQWSASASGAVEVSR